MIEIETTGNIKEGQCDLNKEGCKATSVGAITSVFDAKREIYTCNSCLEHKINAGQWVVKGALTSKQRFR